MICMGIARENYITRTKSITVMIRDITKMRTELGKSTNSIVVYNGLLIFV